MLRRVGNWLVMPCVSPVAPWFQISLTLVIVSYSFGGADQRQYIGNGLFGNASQLIWCSVLDWMRYPSHSGVEAQGFSLGVGSFKECFGCYYASRDAAPI